MANEHREFWSKVAQKYDRVVDLQFGGPMTRSMMRERVAKEGRLGNLAEFGCGTGFYTQVLAGKADSVVATDLSPGMLFLISVVFWGRQESWLWDLDQPRTVALWIAGTAAVALLWPWIYRQIRGLAHDLDQRMNP